MEDTSTYQDKQKWLEALQDRQKEICLERNLQNIGKTFTCLVEKRVAHDKLLARTEGNVRVHFEGSDDMVGSFVELRIQETGPVNMIGVLVGQ